MSAVTPSDRDTRRPDIDWLRVFATYLLLLFHVGMVFNPAPFYHVRNTDVSFFFLILCGFIGLWHMPLLFLLAGWSAAASLRSRGVGTFLRERGSKLAVPLVAGCILLAPSIKYLELRSGQDLNHRGLFVTPEVQQRIRSLVPVELPLAEPFEEDFLTFLPSFFTDPDRFSWSHLWFLAYLLAFTVVLLPVFAAIVRRSTGTGIPSRAWVYAPLAPLVLIQLTLRERYPGPYNLYADWANVSYFATFLLAGSALARWPSLEAVVASEWRRALAVAAAATVLLLGAVLGLVTSTPVVLVAAGVAGWCFVVAWLGAAQRRFASPSRRLAYLAESAFPVYVLHQPVIVLLGVGVVALPLGAGAKFFLLLGGSVAATLALYHFLVRPYRLPRFLLGMKPLAGRGRTRPAHPSGAPALGRS